MAAWLVDFLNFLIRGLGVALQALLQYLPDSPFQAIFYSNTYLSNFLGFINYFVPIQVFSTILSTWLGCIAAYYLVVTVLRWVKTIE